MQTDYREQAPAIAGMVADQRDGTVIISGIQGETSAEVAFGKFVVESAGQSGNDPPTMKLPASGADNFANGGFVAFHQSYDKRLDFGTVGILPKRLLAILTRGPIWTKAEHAMVATDPVYVRHTVNGDTEVGDVRKDADTANAVRLYGARVIKYDATSGLVCIEVDMAAHRAH